MLCRITSFAYTTHIAQPEGIHAVYIVISRRWLGGSQWGIHPRSPQQPLFRRLLPLVMVVAVLGMVAIMVVSGNAANPMTYLFPLIMVASMVGMVTGNQAQSVDERRRVYLRHIDRCRRESREDAEQQRSMMEVVDPDPHALMLFVGSNRMWERGRYDDDFAHVRIGTASQRARTHVSIGETNAV